MLEERFFVSLSAYDRMTVVVCVAGQWLKCFGRMFVLFTYLYCVPTEVVMAVGRKINIKLFGLYLSFFVRH